MDDERHRVDHGADRGAIAVEAALGDHVEGRIAFDVDAVGGIRGAHRHRQVQGDLGLVARLDEGDLVEPEHAAGRDAVGLALRRGPA